MIRTAFLWSALVIVTTLSKETGAPLAACDSMTPNHLGLEPEPVSDCPFVVTQGHLIYGNGSEPINVTIGAPEGSRKTFRGFLIEVSNET